MNTVIATSLANNSHLYTVFLYDKYRIIAHKEVACNSMRHYIIIVFSFCLLSLQGQTYEGSIGNYPVFLELDIAYKDNRAFAFYFYKTQLKNIPLEGGFNLNELILFEKFSDINEQKELFRLAILKDKISGTWQNNGKTLNVDLTETTKNLEDFKLSKLAYVRDSITIHDKKELIWFTEKHSKKSLFRLGNGFASSEREFMNLKLDTIHTYFATLGLDCSRADIKIEIEFISHQYISFNKIASIYCGGAHPSHNTEGFNFDFRNKKLFENITDIYPNLNLFQVLKRKYGNDPDLAAECEYFTSDEDLWDYYSWILTENGITITPSYPHTYTPCEIGFSLTYEELEQSNKD